MDLGDEEGGTGCPVCSNVAEGLEAAASNSSSSTDMDSEWS